MALFSVPMMPQDGSITIEDGTGTPISMTVPYDEGDMQWSGLKSQHKTVQDFKSRGTTFAIRHVEDEHITFSFSATATDFSDGTEKAIIDCIMGTGAFASAVSTLGANADVDTRKVTWTGDETTYGGGADSSIVFDYAHMQVDFAEGVPGKFTISGTAYIIGGSGVTVS